MEGGGAVRAVGNRGVDKGDVGSLEPKRWGCVLECENASSFLGVVGVPKDSPVDDSDKSLDELELVLDGVDEELDVNSLCKSRIDRRSRKDFFL